MTASLIHRPRIWPEHLVTAVAGLLAVCCLGACDPGAPPASAIRALPGIAAAGSAEPHLSKTADGRALLSWLEPHDLETRLRYSVLDDDVWAAPMTVAAGDDWFVNWADFPSVVPLSASLWAAHWLQKKPGASYAYDVAVSLSDDGGANWSAPLTPHRDGTPTEHGFVSLFPWQGGAGALWLDGRNMAGGHDAGSDGGMTLRSAVITATGEVTREQVADDLVCDCCQTDVAIAAGGPVAVYRNRTRDEIRDIYVARSEDGTWLEGVAVADDGWEIAGCPVNGPSISAAGNDLAVAWFTAASDRPLVRVAFSSDGGRSFGDAIDVDGATPIGRVGVLHLDPESILVTWLAQTDGGSADFNAMRVSSSGRRSATVTIAATAAARLSGFPQVIDHGESVVFAWTDITSDGTAVKSAIAPRTLFLLL